MADRAAEFEKHPRKAPGKPAATATTSPSCEAARTVRREPVISFRNMRKPSSNYPALRGTADRG